MFHTFQRISDMKYMWLIVQQCNTDGGIISPAFHIHQRGLLEESSIQDFNDMIHKNESIH